jgi:hypothetical protein
MKCRAAPVREAPDSFFADLIYQNQLFLEAASLPIPPQLHAVKCRTVFTVDAGNFMRR